MIPLAQSVEQEDEYLGFGMYYSEDWGGTYEWRGPDWSNATIEVWTVVSAIGLLLFGGLLIAQVFQRKRMSDWLAYAYFACAYVQGLMFAIAEQGEDWLVVSRYARILPAFTVLVCVAALRRRPNWWVWIPIDLGALSLLVLIFLTEPDMESLTIPLFPLLWAIPLMVVRSRTRGGRTVEGLQADAWRFVAVAHLIAMLPLGLASVSMNEGAVGIVDLLLGGIIFSMSMAALLLGIFQIAINRRTHA